LIEEEEEEEEEGGGGALQPNYPQRLLLHALVIVSLTL
jgi:hypothetical protein